jgi:GH15 family glucan-1,4-alpha-glucosidase
MDPGLHGTRRKTIIEASASGWTEDDLSFSTSTASRWHPSAEQDQRAPAISDYALIGDCRTAALVSLYGAIDWLCLPNFSGPSVFARILDPHGGSFSLHPSEPFEATRRYVEDTAVLETTFRTEHGVARIFDCLPVLDGIRQMRPLREILRIVEGVSGTVAFEVAIDLRPDYARRQRKPRHRGRLGWSWEWGGEIVHVRADTDLSVIKTALCGAAKVDRGERRAFSLAYCCNEPAVIPLLGPSANGRLAETIAWWRGWSTQVAYQGPYRSSVVRSALTLKLLSFAPSGAVIAAPTTSLPEAVGGGRNWDYRYCWLRDAGLTMHAMIGLGIDEDAKAFLDWLLHATRLTWPKLQVMYDIYGRTELDEFELKHLAGYRESRPVRVGNGAHDQKQLDIYGEVILAADTFAAAGGTIDHAGARMLAGLGKVICESWEEPDSGIWEVRGPPRHFTFSKLMCWVALDRLIALHERGAVALGAERERYRSGRAAIAEVIETRAFNRCLGAYTAELDGDRVDASLLLMTSVGYKPANDPRIRSTFDLICERLGPSGLLLRYEHDTDGLDGHEGAFGICSFWAVEQLAARGDLLRAEKQFDHLLAFGNDVGLFAEEIDGQSGEALGNFPQAFTHVGLVNAAIAIEKARRPSDDRASSP